LGRIDVDVIPHMHNGNIATLEGGEVRAIRQVGAIDDFVGEHVVIEDSSELLRGHGRDGGTKGLESRIGGCEDGYVRGVGQVLGELSGVEGAFEGG
jgi:hypothetical protein